MANIYDLANQLEREIRALPEYQAVLAAKEKISVDNNAQVIWDDFLKMQEKFQGMMKTGQLPSQEEQKAMNDLGQKIETNPTLKSYFDEQQRLSIYIQDIEKIVFGPLQDLAK